MSAVNRVERGDYILTTDTEHHPDTFYKIELDNGMTVTIIDPNDKYSPRTCIIAFRQGGAE